MDSGDKARTGVSEGLDELARVRGRGRRGRDREVDEHFGAKRFSEAGDGVEGALGRRLGGKACVLEVFRSDTEDDLLALVRRERRPLRDEPGVDDEPIRAEG